MNKGTLASMLCLLGLMSVSTARADMSDAYEAGTVHFTADLGIADGGDALETFQFTNGSTKTLHAGEAAYVDAGVWYNFTNTSWAIKSTLGYSHASVDASNASTTFSRYPLEVLAEYNYGDNHFGGGAVYHMSPRLSGAGFPDIDFQNALGWAVEYRYSFVGLRLTSIRYTPSNPLLHSVNGNSYGIFFNVTF